MHLFYFFKENGDVRSERKTRPDSLMARLGGTWNQFTTYSQALEQLPTSKT